MQCPFPVFEKKLYYTYLSNVVHTTCIEVKVVSYLMKLQADTTHQVQGPSIAPPPIFCQIRSLCPRCSKENATKYAIDYQHFF